MAFFRVTAVSPLGESIPTDVYGARLGSGDAPLVIVDGADRWETQTSINPSGVNHAFVATHGVSIANHGTPFDSCSNEALHGPVDLRDYTMAVWVLADESTVEETFGLSEQPRVQDFLERGSALMVSGNEIGWDLGRASRPAEDQAFYRDWLHAEYVADDSNDYTVVGAPSPSILAGLDFTFGNGGDAPYHPDWPDVIAPVASEPALEYEPGKVAAIQRFGAFGSGTRPAKLLHMGFAFETINTQAARDEVMDRVLGWFEAPLPAGFSVMGTE